ncbi:TPA: type II toxin-antitoxin system RnlB family antitoxin [Klebsiella quasipneumoniae]|nr:type II toxin-antitoxin system RnlB family antitoxin [Klebsiella quasipneumoniae]
MFKIRHLKDNQYKVIVVATGYDTPLSCLNIIAQRLTEEAFFGPVLFDLLCSNGLEDNRFASISFDGKSFLKKTFHVVDEQLLPKQLIKNQNEFFISHESILKASVLTKSEICNLVSATQQPQKKKQLKSII